MESTVTEASTDDGGSPSRGAGGSSRTVLILVALGSIVVGLVIGGLIGWQVEKKRVEDDVANVRPIGTITAVGDDSFTVKLPTSSGTRKFSLTDATSVEKAEDGTAADLTEGARVFVRSTRNSDRDLQAREVVVLPDTSSGG